MRTAGSKRLHKLSVFGMTSYQILPALASRRRGVFSCVYALCGAFLISHIIPKQLARIPQLQTHDVVRQQSLLKCLRHVLENELPMSRQIVKARQGLDMSLSVAFVHQWDAGRDDVWNEELRFLPTEEIKLPNCSIWEVGANIHAADSRRFMDLFPGCYFHAYEPVPTFATQLEAYWRKHPGSHQLNIHHYGLGAKTYSFTMREEDVMGESTFIDEATSGSVRIQIKNFAQAVQEARGVPSLISLNCEGCEWVLINEGLDAGFFQQVPIIQIGWHNYGQEIGKRVVQLCELRARLSLSHDLVSGVAFGWERWKKKTTKKKKTTTTKKTL